MAVGARHVLLLALSESCATMTLCAQLLALLSPDHWCADERVSALRLQLPLSHQEAKKFSLPPVTIGLPLLQLWTGGNVSTTYSQCERYDGDMAAAYIRWMVAKRPSHPTTAGLLSRRCDQGWEYNASTFFHTVTMQHDWVCGNSWRPYVIQVSFWIGAGIGALLFGLAANKFGRYPVLLASVASILLGDVLTISLAAFGFIAVLASRFIAGFGSLSLQYMSLVHVREVCGAAQQPWLLLVVMTSRIVSSLLVAAVVLAVPSWWLLTLVPAFSSAVCLLLTYRLCHESPWWLLERDRPEDAIKVLQATAARDMKDQNSVDRNVLETMHAAAMQTSNGSYACSQCCRLRNGTVPFAALGATQLCGKHEVILGAVWMVCGVSYYAQLQAAPAVLSTCRNSRLGLWDAAASCWTTSLAEMPAGALPLLLRRGGDNVVAVLRLSLAAAASLSAVGALVQPAEAVGASLAALNRLSAAFASCAALHLVLRCLVHDTRLSGIAVVMCAYGIAAALGPAINLSTEYNTRLPSLILAFVNFIGVMLSLAVSRTRLDKPTHRGVKEGRLRRMACRLSRYLPQRFVMSDCCPGPPDHRTYQQSKMCGIG